MKRRTFLKGSIATGAVGVAVGAGLLTPQMVLAAWPKAAFESTTVDDALTGLFGSKDHTGSDQIKIKAPDIAENGAVVPIVFKRLGFDPAVASGVIAVDRVVQAQLHEACEGYRTLFQDLVPYGSAWLQAVGIGIIGHKGRNCNILDAPPT